MAWVRRHRDLVGFAAVILIVAGSFYWVGTEVTTNSDAIYKGCVLLDNAIAQSQASKANNILVSAIFTLSDAHGDTGVRRRFMAALKKSPPLHRLPCRRLADNPDEIKAVPQVTPTAAPLQHRPH